MHWRVLWEAPKPVEAGRMLSLPIGLHQPHDSTLCWGYRGRLYDLEKGLSEKEDAPEVILNHILLCRAGH